VAGTEANSSLETFAGGDLDGTDDANDTAGDMTVDFGFVPPAAQKVSIGSTVFMDYDNFGIQDPGEDGIANVTVRLYAADGVTVVATTTTDANGTYYFDNVNPGSYFVGVTPAVDAPTSSPDTANTAGDNQIDGDDNGIQTTSGAEARSPMITLVAGTEPDDTVETFIGGDQDNGADADGDMTVDFGFLGLGSVSGNVSHEDKDHLLHGIANVTLVLYDEGGNEVARTQTDANGDYLFEDLRPGKYIVKELQPDGFFNLRENEGGFDDDNTTATGENEISITVDGGEVDIENDFVEVMQTSLGDHVWYDNDNDGVQDSNEPGVEDVLVTLIDEDGNAREMRTDQYGDYHFYQLDPTKDYTVVFDLSTLPTGYALTRPNLGGDDTLDSDADDHGQVTSVILYPGEDNPSIDTGLRPSGATPGRQYLVGTHFWIDNNENGLYDPAVDTPIGGAKVELFHEDGTPVLDEKGQPLVTNTDNKGAYHFYVSEGRYYARFTIPQSYVDEGYAFSNPGTNHDNNINKNTTGNQGITQVIKVDGTTRPADLTLDAAIVCGCSDVGTDSSDAMSKISAMLMMAFVLFVGLIFVRREEQGMIGNR
jgi:hypothetical protein